jgi:hypothetical protein
MKQEGKLSPFPPHNVSPNVKARKEYGLQIAKAIYSHDQIQGPMLFNRDKDFYERASKWYFGDIDESKYMPWLHMDSKDKNSQWLQSIMWEPILYFTKRINTAVSKLATIDYDPIVSAISPNAIKEQVQFEANLKAVMNRKEFFKSAGFDMTEVLPPGVKIDDVPETPEELELFKEMRYKHWASMKIELGIQEAKKRLNFFEIKRQFDFDLTLWNVGRISTWMGSDFRPMGARRDPRVSIVPTSSKPDFSDNQYRADLEEYSLADIAINHPHLTEADMEEVARHASRKYENQYQDSFLQTESLFTVRGNDVERVRVLHFRYKTVNERVSVGMKDRHGNKIVREKGYNAYKTKSSQDEFKNAYGNTREFYRTKYPAVYEGWWVIGSEILLDYRQMPNTIDSSVNEELLGDKVYVPNMRDGRTVSMGRQAIPILELIHRQHLKIQQIVATDIPNGIRINMRALSEAKLKGADGRDMTDMQKIDLYLQKGILIEGSDPRAPGSNVKPIENLQGGMASTIVNHLNILNDYLGRLDEVTGYNNASLGQQVNPRQGKAVTQLQVMGTDQALEYLRNADYQITKSFFSNIGKLHVLAEKYSPDQERSERLYGNVLKPTAGLSRVAEYDYGIDVMAQPTHEEWQEFYGIMQGAYNSGKISASDMAFLKLITNLKMAYQYLAVYETKREKAMADQKLKEIEANNAGNAQAAQVTSESQLQSKQMELQKETVKGDLEIKKEDKRHQNKLKEIQLEKDLELRNSNSQIGKKAEADVEVEISKAEIQEEMNLDNEAN